MGKRSPTETAFGIIAAFIEEPTWTQAALARKLETTTETIRKQLGELQAGGLRFERQVEHPHVFWSLPKNWIPGALAFKADEAHALLRLISRAPRGELRDRVVAMTIARLGAFGQKPAEFDPTAIRPAEIGPDEEQWLAIVENAAAQKVTLKMRYFSTSRRDVAWRHASVQRVDVGPQSQFVAICHRTNELRRFRVSNVQDAKLDAGESFRRASDAALAKFDLESFGGYHDTGPVTHCAFFVRDPEATWVSKNLPDAKITAAPTPGGVRFSVDTPAVAVLARYVAGLGEVARPETLELAAEVARIARAALANATAGPDAPSSRRRPARKRTLK